MLLWMSSGRSKIFFWRGGRNQGAVDLPQDVALEAANDLWFGQPLLGAPLGVGLGGEVVAQPAQHDPVQRTVGGAVAAAVLAGLAVSVLAESGLRPGMRVLTAAEGFPELPSCRIGLVRNAHESSALADALAEHIVSSLDNLSEAQAAE